MRGPARRVVLAAALVAGLAAGLGLHLSRPRPLAPAALAELDTLSPDAERGERVFWAAGCAACHAAPEAEGEARLRLAGGRALVTPFGTFVAPNISPDPDFGIGGWTAADLANAMKRGVAPDGTHFYPAFPYTSYTRMALADIADLHAFLRSLPPDPTPSAKHELRFPFTIRRGLGLWKALFLTDRWVMADAPTEQLARGRYLVEGPGHCGECHTPRGLLGNPDLSRWLAGAPSPSGKGRIPSLRPDRLKWSEADIAYYLSSGFTPDYDVAGGEMIEVVRNLAHLPEADLRAIAAYLKALPPSDRPIGR